MTTRARHGTTLHVATHDVHMLRERRWPGTRSANIDLLLVGPGGVFVVDVKSWPDVRITGGRLWYGQLEAQDHVDNVLRQARVVEEALVVGE